MSAIFLIEKILKYYSVARKENKKALNIHGSHELRSFACSNP